MQEFHCRYINHYITSIQVFLIPISRRVPALPCCTGKWARGGWAASDDDERKVKEETQATLRCFPFDQVSPESSILDVEKMQHP